LLAGFYRQVESDEERKLRLAVLGSPTVRGRRDWCQHFAVSAIAHRAGRADGSRGRGAAQGAFWTCGRAAAASASPTSVPTMHGVAFAARVQKGRAGAGQGATGFAVNDHVPDAAGLTDGFDAEEFRKQIGSFDDDRFAAEVARIRQRIAELPGQKEK